MDFTERRGGTEDNISSHFSADSSFDPSIPRPYKVLRNGNVTARRMGGGVVFITLDSSMNSTESAKTGHLVCVANIREDERERKENCGGEGKDTTRSPA